MNILVTVPLGMILAALFRPVKHSILIPVLIGLTISVTTEGIQYITRRGLCELDDVFNNTLGILLGILLYRLAMRFLKPKTIHAA